jgi:hypothetical protein
MRSILRFALNWGISAEKGREPESIGNLGRDKSSIPPSGSGE